MKLLVEHISAQVITESDKDGQKRMFITGPFLKYGLKNKNGRVYPEKIMEAAVNTYIEEYVSKSRGLGELNHPSDPSVNPERAAIMTTELVKDKNFYHGKAKVLSTPMGKLVESLLNDGVNLGVSSRGVGSVKKVDGLDEVQSDFTLMAAADVVFQPSVAEAMVKGIYENVEWAFDKGIWKRLEVNEDIQKRDIPKIKRSNREEQQLKIFSKLLENLL